MCRRRTLSGGGGASAGRFATETALGEYQALRRSVPAGLVGSSCSSSSLSSLGLASASGGAAWTGQPVVAR